jgi:hypothetical protein
MNLKLFIVIGILTTLVPELKGQIIKTLSISGGMGLPVGRDNYTQDQFANGALFANSRIVLDAALDFTFLSHEHFGFGFYFKRNNYLGWKAPHISDRFENSSVHTFNFGPLFYFNVKRLTSCNRISRIMMVPFISYLKVVNQKSNYNIFSEETLPDGEHAMASFEIEERISRLIQLLPGMYVAYDWAAYVNEKTRFFVRPGLTFMMTNNDGYPDKYVFTPSVSVGFTFDYSRNKWFFIKNN